MVDSWLDRLKRLVLNKPVVVIQFDSNEWLSLKESRCGINKFTIVRPHGLLEAVHVPTACLIIGEDDQEIYFGLAKSRQRVATLDSRIKIERALRIQPSSKPAMVDLVTDKTYALQLRKSLSSYDSVIPLPPKVSVHLVEKLADIDSNHGAMRAVVASLSAPDRYQSMDSLQQDAVRTAMHAFDINDGYSAASLELSKDQSTALARVHIMEDSVVEHDARIFPGYELIGSDVTGRAVFERENERLEIFTANRRRLEQVFGVDLIYFNVTRENIVMVQYKMLEKSVRKGHTDDWIYRPDVNLDSQINRMQKFSKQLPLGQFEYRLNPQVFYLKFVKRDGLLSDPSIVLPIDHFDKLRTDPLCKGLYGAISLSFKRLAGRYFRERPFLDLIRAGYIGATAKTTTHLKELVKAVVNDNRAVVGAIQSHK